MNRFIKSAGLCVGYALGVFLVLRAVAEPFVIDYAHSDSYKHDWGGPTLIGVMFVHMLPGLLALAPIYLHLRGKLHGKRPLK
jgi:hypothetical protein